MTRNPPDAMVVDAPILLALVRDRSMLQQAREAIAEDVLTARASGCTWREIATATGMTERGVQRMHLRAETRRTN